MNADEIVNVVERFQSAWPWDQWDTDRMDEWCKALESIDGGIGEKVARRMIETKDRTPSIAVFLAEAHSEFERRRTGTRVTTPDRPAGRASAIPQTVRDAMERLSGPTPRHDHHAGWQGCPVCVNYPPKGAVS